MAQDPLRKVFTTRTVTVSSQDALLYHKGHFQRIALHVISFDLNPVKPYSSDHDNGREGAFLARMEDLRDSEDSEPCLEFPTPLRIIVAVAG